MFFIGDKKVSMEELVTIIKPGDACLEGYRPDWKVWDDVLAFAIQHWTESWCNHAFMFTGQYIDPPGGPFGLKCTTRDWIILQSIGKGVVASKLSDYAGNGHIVKFVHHALCTANDRPAVVKAMYGLMGHGYDITGLFGFFLRPFWPFYHNIFAGKSNYFCSAAVATAYASRQLFFRTDVAPDYVSPGDIWGSGASIHY
jgi:hypothetical protein